ncbi:MAG: DinB family protein [Actinomycetales bacterium]
MTSVLPAAPERLDPRPEWDERDLLLGFLRWQRLTLLRKCQGLTAEQLRTAAVPTSSLTLAGLIKHLAFVEESWLVEDFRGDPMPQPWAGVDWDADPDWEFRTALDDSPTWLIDRYHEAWERVDAIVAETDLRALSAAEVRIDDRRERVLLRWILYHLVEETARHNGHADLLREAIDGSVGE